MQQAVACQKQPSPRKTYCQCTYNLAEHLSERGACGPTTIPRAELASQCYPEDGAETSHRVPASVRARVLTESFAHPQAGYQSPRNSPRAQTDADTQGKIHHARPDQKSPWRATISPRGTGFIRLSLQRFQALLTLFSKSFSPFPHGTCLLSVSNQYLALDEIYHPLGAPVPRNVTR